MPILVQKVAPSLQTPQQGVGLQIPFSSDSVFTLNYSSEIAMKNNIIHFLLTEQGECYLNPNRGFNLYGYLFEQNSEETLQNLSQNIETVLKNRFSRITKVVVDVSPVEDRRILQLEIKYTADFSEKENVIMLNIEQ